MLLTIKYKGFSLSAVTEIERGAADDELPYVKEVTKIHYKDCRGNYADISAVLKALDVDIERELHPLLIKEYNRLKQQSDLAKKLRK